MWSTHRYFVVVVVVFTGVFFFASFQSRCLYDSVFFFVCFGLGLVWFGMQSHLCQCIYREIIGPGESATAFIDFCSCLWNDPSHDADFFNCGVSVVVLSESCGVLSIFIVTEAGADDCCWLSSNFVHAKSIDDSVAKLSAFSVMFSQRYLQKNRFEEHRFSRSDS